MTLAAREVLEACLYVDSLAAARAFYTDVLGLTIFDEQAGHHLFLRCGNRMVLLFLPYASVANDGPLPAHGALGAGHLAFAVSAEEIAQWPAHLAEHGVKIESVIDWPERGRSIYFRDPAGNSLEIATPSLWKLDESKTLPSG